MAVLLIPLAIAAGFMIPVQFGVNSTLRTYAGGPISAAAISFLTGTLILLLVVPVSRERISLSRLGHAPLWAWGGGVLGVVYVVASIVLAPRLGAGTTIALIICGQMLGALILDQFGLLRLPVHHAGPARLLGAVLMIAGVTLIEKF